MKRFFSIFLVALHLLLPVHSWAATLFAETPDATQGKEFWSMVTGTVAYDSTTPTKSGVASWKFGDAATSQLNLLRTGSVLGTTARFSGYVRINDLPSTASARLVTISAANLTGVLILFVRSTGAIFLTNSSSVQIGSDGATLSTGVWYRITLAWNITSTTVYNVKVFVDGVQSISGSNSPTLDNASPALLSINYVSPGVAKYANWQHVYADDGAGVDDPGDIRVTAKRPNANGTTNGFTTQIGSGGSGYGSGHSPQVNERALSTTNGWSHVVTGSAITEEYTIENAATGDVNLTGATLVDYVGWVYASSLASETAQIVAGGATSNISLTSTPTMFTKIAGSTTYPAGGTDIGIVTATTATTVSLYEAGTMMIYKPTGCPRTFALLGVGC